jgi:hypothetical protein
MPSNVPPGDNARMAELLAVQQAMQSRSTRLAPIPEQPSMPARPMPETWRTWRTYQEQAAKNQGTQSIKPHQDLRDNPAMRHHLKAGVGPTKSSPSR